MYLHIGKDIMIKENDIIGIFDIESIKNTEEYENIQKKLKEKNRLIEISENTKKTLILLLENKEIKGYITNISSVTLCNRIL